MIVTAIALLIASSSSASEKPLRIGFIAGSSIGSHGWSFSHDLCRKAVEEHFGDRVETALFADDQADEAKAELVMRTMLESGYGMIFVWAYEFEALAHYFAKQHPDVFFEIATGRSTAKNVSTYSARFYEGRYSAGILAAMKSSTGRIGYIAPFPIPEVVRGVNAVALGARRVRPDAEVLTVWTGSWRSARNETFASEFLIAAGVDVLVTHTSGHEPLMIAESKGVFGFGKASDMTHFAPNAHLATIANDWNQYCIERVGAVLDGTWTTSDVWGGQNGPFARLTHFNQKHVDPETKSSVLELESQVLSGEVHPFTGPIRDEDGNLRVLESETLTDAQLLGMDWFVDGVRIVEFE